MLVVEDEPLIRMDATDMVLAAGFEAIEAANADEAVAILEARKDICVVFTDIDMPGSMDGLKLAAAVAKRWPPIKLILTSGHIRVSSDQMPAGGRFFPKPYRERDIARTIRENDPKPVADAAAIETSLL